MNLKNPETTKKIAKNLTVLAVLILSLSTIFFAQKTISAPPTLDCSAVSGTPQPGDNCLYYYPLPLCSDVPGKTWTIPTSSILTAGSIPSHRINCADLSDLPLCSQVSDTLTAYPLKNCVNECSTISNPDSARVPANVKGVDYAIHNKDCIRFCDALEAGVTANSGVNCVARSCHQVAYGGIGAPTSGNVVPNPPTNCNLLPCNLLTPNELNESKFFGDTNTSGYKYCDNSVKCFNFTQAQLPYLKVGSNCKIHNCRAACVNNSNDDVSIILAKTSGYISDYQRLINGNYAVGSLSEPICTPTYCKPIVQVPYRCDPQPDPSPVIPNVACDSTGTGHTCSNGYCYATIDCNLDANANSINCATGGTSSQVGTINDSGINSWFYRPYPVDTALNNNGTVKDFHTDSSFSSDSVGYEVSQMRDYGFGSQAMFEIDFSWLGGGKVKVDMGYMHSSVFGDGPRSPGMKPKITNPNLGDRGFGFGYLCDMHANIYNKPRYDTAYHSGYVETNFTDTDATHTLEVCLRFTNILAFDHSCGKRECSVSCVFASDDGLGCTQLCGYDICRTLKIKDSDSYQCVMSGDIFTGGSGSMIGNDSDRDCMGTIDGYLRLRAVKYGEYICTFLDAKGILAYNAIYLNGSEKFADGTCMSGTNNGGTCGGKNTNDDPGTADKWRTVMRIRYIENKLAASEPQGYLNKSGQLFPAQECIKVPHRITVPPLYNLANISNSPNIFIPPLYILNVSTRKGGGLSSIPIDQTLGDTDFHYPEITVSFGIVTQKLSLDFDKTGYEEPDSADPQASATITSELFNSAEVFIRKEYDEVADRPTLCLYQKFKDLNGTYIDPKRISCVNRNYPDINNSANKVLLPSIDFRKLFASADATNTYSSSRIAIRYLSSSVNGATCTSAQTSCTTDTLLLANTDPSVETCDSSVENHKICVKREECSKLNIECIQNEIDAHNAELANQPLDSFSIIRNQCNQILLPFCNAKFGIVASSAATITNQNPSGAAADPNAYGWFNEICITSGFSTKLKRVISYKIDNGSLGKCAIDFSKKIAGADCSAGGNAPNCPCLEYISEMSLTADQIDRNETPHEAGLCIDMPLPQLCPAINHNPVPNSSPSDPDYIQSSLNQIAYGTSISQITNLVHISHQYRTFGSLSPSIPVAGHAEFSQSIFGLNDVRGTCTGFWKQTTSTSGYQLPPTASCLNNGGVASWGAVTNSCVRYSCPAISTTGMDVNGNYQGGYGILEDGEDKGLSNGFANWTVIESTDFPVNATSSGCITGFKTVAAVASMSNEETNVEKAALYSQITGYSVVTLPTRKCNQLGTWQTTTNNCERISCAAINQDANGNITNSPSTSGSNPGDSAKWELWSNSGGASYPSVNAARSSILVNNSIVKSSATSTGACNNKLGFFRISGGSAPTRVCDSLGNWGPVQNACITECAAITDLGIASTTNNGYAYWHKAINVPISGELSTNTDGCNNPSSNPRFNGTNGSCETTGFNGCASGYVTYPYPALRDKYGVTYTLIDGTKPSDYNYTTTIPRNVNKDTRDAENPVRTCKSIVVVGGQANVWTNTSSTCVNSCPGADIDPRINVGKTQHKASSNVYEPNNRANGVVTISWPTTLFGETVYINSPSEINSHNGSQYFYGRTNGHYSLSRKCSATTHKWEDPIAYCVTNNGYIKIGPNNSDKEAHAYYDNTNSGRIAVGLQTAAGTCRSGSYSNTSGSTIASKATCSYKSSDNKNIDEIYFNTGSAAKCIAGCTSVGEANFGNATNPSTSASTAYYSAGTQLNLNCKSGYGNNILTTSQTPHTDYCGRSPSDRSASRPFVMCNDNGNGTASWSSVYNDCESCRGCADDSSASIPSDIKTNYTSETYRDNNMCDTLNDDSCSIDITFNSSCYPDLTSGGSHTCTERGSCRNKINSCERNYNFSVEFVVKCFDGLPILTSSNITEYR